MFTIVRKHLLSSHFLQFVKNMYCVSWLTVSWYQYNLDINNNSAAPSPLRLPATTYKQLDHDFIVKLQTEVREGSITEKAPTRAFS